MIWICVFVVGLIVGSFLNVCIYRVPEGKSVVKPRSACPKCGKLIVFYDNIPLLSFLILKGKCRHCGGAISWQYPVVEAANGLLWVLVGWKFGLTPPTLFYAAFVSAMLVLAFIDVRHRILPHGITFGGLALGFLSAPWQVIHHLDWPGDRHVQFTQQLLRLMGVETSSVLGIGWVDSLLGIFCGAGMLLLVAVGYWLVKKVEGMGHGDIIMMGFVGSVLGWSLAFLTVFLGALIGAVVGVVIIQCSGKDRKYEIPFGAFLGLAAVITLLVGDVLLNWYWSFL